MDVEEVIRDELAAEDPKPEDQASKEIWRGRRRVAMTKELIERRRKRRTAVEMRIAGASFAAIAKALGFKSASAASVQYYKALRSVTQERAEDALNLELERVDRLIFHHWPKKESDWKAVDEDRTNFLLSLIERRWRLLGLGPHKSEVKAEILSANVQVSATAKTLIERADNDPRLREAILDVDERLRLGPGSSHAEPGGVRALGDDQVAGGVEVARVQDASAHPPAESEAGEVGER